MAQNRNDAYRVVPTRVIPDVPIKGKFKSLCLSTGIDSTYVLLKHKKPLNLTHAMVVHGADYRPRHTIGFDELYSRVTGMAKIAGLEPISVKTNLRKLDYSWGMQHIAQLAACMHFLGPKFSDVVFSADNTIAQDMYRFPWGNNYALSTNVGSGTNRTHYLGYDATRYEKIKAIQADGSYLEHIGVCAAQKETGGNCGLCGKCLMTRIAFECGGQTCPPIFKNMPDPAQHLREIASSPRKLKSGGIRIRANELLPHVEDMEIREGLITYRDAARRVQARKVRARKPFQLIRSLIPHTIKKRLLALDPTR